MKKDGIQTRKRKPKSGGSSHMQSLAGPSGLSLHQPRSMSKYKKVHLGVTLQT